MSEIAPPEEPGPSGRSAERRRRPSGGTVLYAAMLGVADVIQPEKTKVEIEQQDDQPLDGLGLDLSFGDLPPIDDR